MPQGYDGVDKFRKQSSSGKDKTAKEGSSKNLWDEASIKQNPSVTPKKLPQRVYKRGTQGTLVYSPDIAVYIYTESHGIIDIGPYMTSFSIQRGVNDVSTFTCTFDNKYSRYDRVIRRMDRVAVFLKRIEWLQVFAGYITMAPWETVVPGDSQIEAECTLKRLKHTFWDPNNPASYHLYPYMNISGAWRPDKADSGAAMSMYEILTTIGHWDSGQIKIQAIPEAWLQKASELISMVDQEEFGEAGGEQQIVKEAIKKLMSANGWIKGDEQSVTGETTGSSVTPTTGTGEGDADAGSSTPANVDTTAPANAEESFRQGKTLGNLAPDVLTTVSGVKLSNSAPTSLRGQDLVLRNDAAVALEQVFQNGGSKLKSNIAVGYLPRTTLNNLTNGSPPRSANLPSKQQVIGRRS